MATIRLKCLTMLSRIAIIEIMHESCRESSKFVFDLLEPERPKIESGGGWRGLNRNSLAM
jgi:hypothetical protein